MKQFRCNLKAILNNLLRIYCTYQQLFLFFNDTIFVWFVTIILFDLFVSNWVTLGQNMVVRIGRHVQPFCSSRKQFIFTARSTHWALVTTRKTKQTDKWMSQVPWRDIHSLHLWVKIPVQSWWWYQYWHSYWMKKQHQLHQIKLILF